MGAITPVALVAHLSAQDAERQRHTARVVAGHLSTLETLNVTLTRPSAGSR